MTAGPLGRRAFLASASALAVAGCAGSGGNAPDVAAEADPVGAPESLVLYRMARLIYPHAALPDDVYIDVVRGMADAAASDPARLALLRDGARTLADGRPLAWISRPEAEQLASLAAIEATPFFAAVRSDVQTRLYVHPAAWALLGYPGPALPFGGYVDKGFDDIDWLPA